MIILSVHEKTKEILSTKPFRCTMNKTVLVEDIIIATKVSKLAEVCLPVPFPEKEDFEAIPR